MFDLFHRPSRGLIHGRLEETTLSNQEPYKALDTNCLVERRSRKPTRPTPASAIVGTSGNKAPANFVDSLFVEGSLHGEEHIHDKAPAHDEKGPQIAHKRRRLVKGTASKRVEPRKLAPFRDEAVHDDSDTIRIVDSMDLAQGEKLQDCLALRTRGASAKRSQRKSYNGPSTRGAAR